MKSSKGLLACELPNAEIESKTLTSCGQSDGFDVPTRDLTVANRENGLSVSVTLPCLSSPDNLCTVSKWSKWGPCKQYRAGEYLQRRTRFPTDWTSQNIISCGALSENKTCPIDKSYGWQWGDWSECKLTNKRNRLSVCGQGQQFRSKGRKTLYRIGHYVISLISYDSYDKSKVDDIWSKWTVRGR